MKADELKAYISGNNLIEDILNKLDCHDLKEYSSEWRAALPNHDNPTAVCVKKDTLSVVIRNKEGNKSGDIFTLIMYIKRCTFGKSVKIMHDMLGLKYCFTPIKNEVKRYDPLEIFKRIKRQRYVVNDDVMTYDESCLKEYSPLPHISWVREGIMPDVCSKFHIGYSFDKKRIIIPWEKFGDEGEKFLGIVGRTTIPNYELFNIPKYFGIVPFRKGLTLYGINENYQSIQESGYVTVFEAEKSVLKRCSRRDETGVAIGNCELTEEQVRILISLNVEVVLAFDEGIDYYRVLKECDKFYPIRKISFIFDRWELIKKGSKDSPADMPNKIYKFLFKHRFTYDEGKRKEFKEWQEKRKRN